MSTDRRKEIVKHLTPGELDDRIDDAADPELVRRLCFVKNLYYGDTLAEAAARVGKSQPTGVRWADRWNDGGVDGLVPGRGEGRPPKLDEAQRERLQRLLAGDEPWTPREVGDLIEDEFDVSYHPNYVYELLDSFDVDTTSSRQ